LIRESLPGFGVLTHDIFANEPILLADHNLSRTAMAGQTMATRVLPFGNYCCTSGAPLPIVDLDILQNIGNYLRRTFGRTNNLRKLPRQQALLLESFITQTCLRFGASLRVAYAEC
jgi:hypothetical protein